MDIFQTAGTINPHSSLLTLWNLHFAAKETEAQRVKELAQGHVASKWQILDMNPGSPPESEHLIFTLYPRLVVIGSPSPIIKKRLVSLCFCFVLL